MFSKIISKRKERWRMMSKIFDLFWKSLALFVAGVYAYEIYCDYLITGKLF